jgi:hypothetical protein
MIENIPIVIPNSERKVLNLLTITELRANRKPSLNSLKNILSVYYKIFWRVKDKKPEIMTYIKEGKMYNWVLVKEKLSE